MTPFAALALYPLWAVSVLLGVTALRLGRAPGWGLVTLCFTLAGWVTGLVLLQDPRTVAVAERVLPAGMLLAGAFVHAGVDLTGAGPRFRLPAYAWGVAVAAVGAVAPHLYYAPALAAPGPLFWPIAAVSALGTAATVVWLWRAGVAASARDRRRRRALAAGAFTGSLGGGGVLAAHSLVGVPVAWSAPPLFAAVVLTSYAVLSGQTGRSRRLVRQGLVYSVITAALSSVGLVVFFALLPRLAPGGGESVAWLVVVTFFAALPLDGLRMLLVEMSGRRLFRAPSGVRDLADEAERSETRAEHAARLAEIGAMASAVAHEIRNPLGILVAQAKILERTGADPESVAEIRRQVERARRFLEDLLRYSRPRPLDVQPLQVAEALRAAVESVRRAEPDALPPVELDVESCELEADPGAFHDAHVAILANAVAALDGLAGGRIKVSARPVAGAVEVAIEDDGPGVPPEIEDRLFEPFVSGRGRDSAHPGTGLGLAISARAVERHGGAVRHERPTGGGARFVVRWPRA